MRISKKFTAALARRKAAFQPAMPNENKTVCHMPGSQNRKKGCSAKAGK